MHVIQLCHPLAGKKSGTGDTQALGRIVTFPCVAMTPFTSWLAASAPTSAGVAHTWTLMQSLPHGEEAQRLGCSRIQAGAWSTCPKKLPWAVGNSVSRSCCAKRMVFAPRSACSRQAAAWQEAAAGNLLPAFRAHCCWLVAG